MSRGRFVVAAALAGLLSVAGCGGSSGGAADSSPSSAAPTDPSSAASSSAPAGPYAGYPPATGPRVRLSTYTIRAPQGWRLDHSFGSHAVFADDGGDQIEFSELSFPSGVSLDRMARISLRGSVWSRKPRIRPHVTIGSTAFYHLAGSTGGGEYVEEYGAPRHGRRMKVTFDLYSGRRAALRTIGSVMATFRVR